MSDVLGTYTFLPWLRRGVANQISGAGAAQRVTIDVSLDIRGELKAGGDTTVTVDQAVELYGPGDIVGIDQAQISRLEPNPWVSNFEPNYLPAIEFYDEAFPWLYTPAAPSGRRLLPWLSLIVLEEGEEFAEGKGIAGRPLPFIEVTTDFATAFPPAEEGWAWAHAHFNQPFSDAVVETNAILAATKAQDVIDRAPDTANSRLICPRKLKPKTAYHAFLIPAFESGRLAGLGLDPAPLFADPANALTPTSSAWGAYGVEANRPEAAYFPIYHRWQFRTAAQGDFESLVRALTAKPADPRVGTRDMDVTNPATNVTGIGDPALKGVLRLGGALRAPLPKLGTPERDEHTQFENWARPHPHPFQSELAAYLNLPDSYQSIGVAANSDGELGSEVNGYPDPIVTPPLYGRWHAMMDRVLTDRVGAPLPNNQNWVHDLNLDPRHRTAAGFGTKVVQQNQEAYMSAAWDQIGDVLEANRRIREAQLAKYAGLRLHARHMTAQFEMANAALINFSAPLRARVMSEGVTVHHQMTQSPMGVTLTSAALRRAVRPSGRLARRVGLTSPAKRAELVDRANQGQVTAAPPKTPPTEILSPDDLTDAVYGPAPETGPTTGGGGTDLVRWARRRPLLSVLLLLFLLIVIYLLFGIWLLGAGIAIAVVAGLGALLRRGARAAASTGPVATGLREASMTPAAVDALPGASGFVYTADVSPLTDVPVPTVRPGETDNAQAQSFKAAMRDQYAVIEASRIAGAQAPLRPVNTANVAVDIQTQLNPALTVPRWTFSGIALPERLLDQMPERFVEAMAYPEFDTPMYAPLVKAGTELFVPNLHLVDPNSVTLLETNQQFIEAYMVGLNHEFARELLWREYVTDQRGSYFRQFWDVRKKIAQADDPEAARETYRDIKPLHLWSKRTDLGDHDNREEGSDREEELVLVVRGELLRKYPNTIISAQKAKWQLKDGEPDKAQERLLDESVDPLLPIYEARVAPDIYFFGFDLTAVEAMGDDDVADKPGWFFRLEEVPGDARFGFDIQRDGEMNVWNDMSWADVLPTVDHGRYVRVADIPNHSLIEPTDPSLSEKRPQWEFDRDVSLNGASLSAAELAYVALQTPVVIAVHASELLNGS